MGGKATPKRSSKKVVKPAEEEETYTVEKIVDDRIIKGKTQYKVHWAGYTTDEETWENESQLDCQELLDEYLADKPQEEPESPPPASTSEPPKKKFKGTTGTSSKTSDDGTKEYIVEKIIDHKKEEGKDKYLVHWQGFSTEEDSWESASHLDCQELIDEYLNSKKSKNKKNKKESKKEKKTSIKQENETTESANGDNEVKNGDEEENSNEEPRKTRKTMEKDTKKNSKKEKKTVAKESKKEKPDKSENGDDAQEDGESENEDTKEYEVEKILDMHTLKTGKREFLVRWKGYSKNDDTWEPEKHLEGTEILERFLKKVEKAKEALPKELRLQRKPTDRFTAHGGSRRASRRNGNRQRTKYYDAE